MFFFANFQADVSNNLIHFISVYICLQHVPACVRQVTTDIFVEEVQVPIDQVAFLNLAVFYLFYNFYVCLNMNYIVVTH